MSDKEKRKAALDKAIKYKQQKKREKYEKRKDRLEQSQEEQN